MHELAVCQALLDQVHAVAAGHDDAPVTCITVAIGPLSGVVPDLLERAFYLARAGSCAAHAELVLEVSGVRVRCHSCGAETEATPAHLICGRCGEFRTELVDGDQLILKRIELVDIQASPTSHPAGEQSCATHADAT